MNKTYIAIWLNNVNLKFISPNILKLWDSHIEIYIEIKSHTANNNLIFHYAKAKAYYIYDEYVYEEYALDQTFPHMASYR